VGLKDCVLQVCAFLDTDSRTEIDLIAVRSRISLSQVDANTLRLCTSGFSIQVVVVEEALLLRRSIVMEAKLCRCTDLTCRSREECEKATFKAVDFERSVGSSSARGKRVTLLKSNWYFREDVWRAKEWKRAVDGAGRYLRVDWHTIIVGGPRQQAKRAKETS
jgi:hypothetical protein